MGPIRSFQNPPGPRFPGGGAPVVFAPLDAATRRYRDAGRRVGGVGDGHVGGDAPAATPCRVRAIGAHGAGPTAGREADGAEHGSDDNAHGSSLLTLWVLSIPRDVEYP